MRLPFIFCLSVFAALGSAQQLPSVPDEAKQFDFWVGSWKVTTPDGKIAGHNDIKSILGGRVVQGNYTTPGLYAGQSYNSYNPGKQRWEQFWVDNTGTVLHLYGLLPGKANEPTGFSS